MIKKKIAIFTLAMMNVAAVGSIRNWPMLAEYGLCSLFYFVLAVLIFFLPVSLVSAELATGWPQQGGMFLWIKEAFGYRWGCLAVWLLWFESIIWYPILLSFISATFFYIFQPSLTSNENKICILLISVILFWLMTWINLKGIKVSGKVSIFGVIFGNFLPAVALITLSGICFFLAKTAPVTLNWNTLLPQQLDWKQLSIFSGILLSLCGIEISSIHASDVDNPKRSYPRAILLSTLLIVSLSLLGMISIVLVVPGETINLAAGSMQAFAALVEICCLPKSIPVMAFLIFVGALASLSTWIVGPCRAVFTMAEKEGLPQIFTKLNRHEMPSFLLIVQGIAVTFLNSIFLFMPTINSAYWILTVLAVQAYLIMYIFMFAAAVKLRYTHAHLVRGYQIPGKKIGVWSVSGIGIVSCLGCFILSFIPPIQISFLNPSEYILLLIIGMVLIYTIPAFLFSSMKRSI